MAEGIVTTTDAEFRGILEGRPEAVAEVALAARRLPPAEITVES